MVPIDQHESNQNIFLDLDVLRGKGSLCYI